MHCLLAHPQFLEFHTSIMPASVNHIISSDDSYIRNKFNLIILLTHLILYPKWYWNTHWIFPDSVIIPTSTSRRSMSCIMSLNQQGFSCKLCQKKVKKNIPSTPRSLQKLVYSTTIPLTKKPSLRTTCAQQTINVHIPTSPLQSTLSMPRLLTTYPTPNVCVLFHYYITARCLLFLLIIMRPCFSLASPTPSWCSITLPVPLDHHQVDDTMHGWGKYLLVGAE